MSRAHFLISLPPAVALLFALWAAACDVRTRRIPNRLVLLCLPVALLCQFASAGWRGVAEGAAAASIAFTVMCLGYFMGGLGAGDVKLMGAMGAFTGTHALMLLMTATALAGGIAGLLLWGYCNGARRASAMNGHPQARPCTIPYALPIACGVSLVFCQTLRSFAS